MKKILFLLTVIILCIPKCGMTQIDIMGIHNTLVTNDVSITAKPVFIGTAGFIARIQPGPDYTKAPNSYIFDISKSEDGLKIPVKKAYAVNNNTNLLNTLIPTTANLQAYIMWEDVLGLIRSTNYKLEVEGIGENAKIKVIRDKRKGKGNAVVALYDLPNGTIPDENTPVLWSWHVWITDNPHLNEATNLLMDRNLGATNTHFTGHDWHKSGGLMYQWGRKDPFPPLRYKDELPYLVSGIIGTKRHKTFYSNHASEWEKLPYTPNASLNTNLKFSVNNPTKFLTNTNTSLNWWGGSNDLLWRNDKIKSAFDPCPNGYRVPKNNLIDTAIPNLLSTSESIKISPSLGIDFRSSSNQKLRNIGLLPHTGKINYNEGTYVDNYSEAHLHYSNGSIGSTGQPWELKIISDAHRVEIAGFGQTTYGDQSMSQQGTSSYVGLPCRCEKQDSSEFVGYTESDFNTDLFFSSGHTPPTYVTETNLSLPNSYVVITTGGEVSHSIPTAKAYAMHYQYLTDRGEAPSGQKAVSVFWTDNPNLVKSIPSTVTGTAADSINVVLNGSQFGNAVIALHEGSTIETAVLWSWHIWTPKENPIEVPYTTEGNLPIASNTKLVNPTMTGFPPLTTTFMNMNLGALNPMPNNLPTELSMSNPLINSIRASTGLHYQWGRKDPLPTPFMNTNPSHLLYPSDINIYRQIEVNNVRSFNPIDVSENLDWSFSPPKMNSSYIQNFTKNFNDYSVEAEINNSNNTSSNVSKIIRYSARNPLTFLFQYSNGCVGECVDFRSKSLDWLSTKDGLMLERWGHGTKKSPFDPCPDEWRVPDASLGKISGDVSTGVWSGIGMRGNSPWYFSDKNTDLNNINIPSSGINQFSIAPTTEYINTNDSYLNTTYPGRRIHSQKVLSEPLTFHSVYSFGWIFNHDDFKIGNIPSSGIRGSDGGNDFQTTDGSVTYQNYPDYGYRAGLWTSSIGDESGHAMALEVHGFFNGLASGTIHNKMAAMSCRCVKDEPRIPLITPNQTNARKGNTDVTTYEAEEIEKLEVFPNPVTELLRINSTESFDYEFYDLNAQLVQKGKAENQSISVSSLPASVYILKLINVKDGSVYINKIIKN